MKDLIDIVAIEDNRMFIDGLRAWAGSAASAWPGRGNRAAAAEPDDPVFVLLLSSTLRAGADPAVTYTGWSRGHRVVVIDGSADLSWSRARSPRAHGYLTPNHDMAALARRCARSRSGGTAWSLGPTMAAESGG